MAGPASPERHRLILASGFRRAKPIGPFGASSYLVLLRVMLTLPSTSPWTRWALTPPFHPYPGTYPKIVPGRFVFCGAHVGLLRLGVTQHPALWSPDFPLTCEQMSGHLTHALIPGNYDTQYLSWKQETREKRKGAFRIRLSIHVFLSHGFLGAQAFRRFIESFFIVQNAIAVGTGQQFISPLHAGN